MIVSMTQWIKNLISLVLCITFFEMLLPRGSITKYARFVFGLLIIVSLLDPLLSLRSHLASDLVVQGLSRELSDVSSRRMEQDIIEQGEKLIVKSYTRKLGDYIRNILIVSEGIKDASVYVLAEPAGNIKTIDIVVSLVGSDDGVVGVEPDEQGQISVKLPGVKRIEVSVLDGSDTTNVDLQSDRSHQVVEKVRKIVADVCGISKESINVSVI